MTFSIDRTGSIDRFKGRVTARCGGSGSPRNTDAGYGATHVPRRGVLGEIRSNRFGLEALSPRVRGGRSFILARVCRR